MYIATIYNIVILYCYNNYNNIDIISQNKFNTSSVLSKNNIRMKLTLMGKLYICAYSLHTKCICIYVIGGVSGGRSKTE